MALADISRNAVPGRRSAALPADDPTPPVDRPIPPPLLLLLPPPPLLLPMGFASCCERSPAPWDASRERCAEVAAADPIRAEPSRPTGDPPPGSLERRTAAAASSRACRRANMNSALVTRGRPLSPDTDSPAPALAVVAAAAAAADSFGVPVPLPAQLVPFFFFFSLSGRPAASSAAS